MPAFGAAASRTRPPSSRPGTAPRRRTRPPPSCPRRGCAGRARRTRRSPPRRPGRPAPGQSRWPFRPVGPPLHSPIVTTRTLEARGRVVAIGGGMAAVRVNGAEKVAKLAGRLRRGSRRVAGDDVEVTVMDDGPARINAIEARRTQFVRGQRLGRGDQVLFPNPALLVVVAGAADPP